MEKLSNHDEREIASYVKHQPHSLGSHKAAKKAYDTKKKDMTKKLKQHSWLDKHVEHQKKSQGQFHDLINYSKKK